MARPVQVLNAGQRVAGGVAARGGAEQQVDDHAGGRALVVGEVRAVAADQLVGAGTAAERVVARATVERIGVGVAIKMVGEGGAGDVLDRLQRVARGIAAGSGAGREIDRDGRGGEAVIGGIGADPAIERIGPGAAVEPVVALAPVDLVVAGIAGELVRARAGIDEVVAPAGRQDVVAIPAPELVVGRIACEVVVEIAAVELLDARIGVALGIAADPGGAGFEVDRHGGRRAEIVHEIAAVPPVERVGPGAAGEDIVAVITVEGVVAVSTDDRVLVRAAGEDVVAGMPAELVIAVAAIDRVVAAGAVEHIVAAQAAGRVGVGRAGKEIVIRSSGEIRHPGDLRKGPCPVTPSRICLRSKMGVGCAKAPASPAQAVSLRVESPETSAAASPGERERDAGPGIHRKVFLLVDGRGPRHHGRSIAGLDRPGDPATPSSEGDPAAVARGGGAGVHRPTGVDGDAARRPFRGAGAARGTGRDIQDFLWPQH